ncbi:HEAT repeat domain-containing protein [Archangium lansingense]|uniref:HEAT repeat domain-containing protein n=1 Tax=Archangium lansingense TaxID=2995310 RepID=A0ABT3ZWD0_9BACT|nr:HEAT repeat domain-containing protein [Archangium lansinium]MCY1073713.1 HEAT repeat domain-containing protein [Archangium lansinium]
MQRTSTKVAVLFGALLLIVLGAALLSRRSDLAGEGSSDSTASAEGSTGKARGTTGSSNAAGSAQPEEATPKEDVLPMPGCWEGIAAFDKDTSLDKFRQALSAAVGAGDRELAQYLQERLTELVGGDASRALQVLEWAEKSGQPELGVYMEALKDAAAVHDPKVVERLLKMGEDKGAQIVNRAAAFDTLESQKRLSAANMQRLKAVAMDLSSDSAGWVATRTLGRVMKEDYERTGNFAPYWKELMDIGEKSEDMAVRLLALEMPSYSNPIIGEDSIERLSAIMRNDKERDVREMAAFRLAVTETPEKALEAYRTAFPAEQDECVRWAIFRFAVRAGGAQALPLLAQMAAQDPRFLQDYQDFQKLYAEGTVDFARIWLGKEERHQCLVEEGAPH